VLITKQNTVGNEVHHANTECSYNAIERTRQDLPVDVKRQYFRIITIPLVCETQKGEMRYSESLFSISKLVFTPTSTSCFSLVTEDYYNLDL
jgi:hypothetical protein